MAQEGIEQVQLMESPWIQGGTHSYDQLQSLRKRLAQKRRRAESHLDQDLVLRKKAPYGVTQVQSQTKVISGIWVGRSAQGNQEVYRRFAHREVWFLHARVRGGSLVISESGPGTQSFLKARTLALIYSKNLKTHGMTSGYVDHTTKIRQGKHKGSFVFLEPRCEWAEPLGLYLHLGSKTFLTFEQTPYRLRPLRQGQTLSSKIRALRIQGLGLSPQDRSQIQGLFPPGWGLDP